MVFLAGSQCKNKYFFIISFLFHKTKKKLTAWELLIHLKMMNTTRIECSRKQGYKVAINSLAATTAAAVATTYKLQTSGGLFLSLASLLSLREQANFLNSCLVLNFCPNFRSCGRDSRQRRRSANKSCSPLHHLQSRLIDDYTIIGLLDRQAS